MKSFASKVFFLATVMSLLFISEAWSSEKTSSQPVTKNPVGVEAIVTKIEAKSLTLKPTEGDSSEISVPRSDDGTFRVGDKVVLLGKDIKKLGGETAQGASTEKTVPDPRPKQETSESLGNGK